MQHTDALYNLVAQLSMVVMWLVFAVFNLSLVLSALLVFWLFSINPSQIFAWASHFYQTSHLATVASTLALGGASVATVVYWYVRVWRKAYSALVTPFLFSGINAHIKNT